MEVTQQIKILLYNYFKMLKQKKIRSTSVKIKLFNN